MILKTITCHHVYNYGASLQSHALMYILSKLGHQVEIIDYIPSYVKDYNSLWMIGDRYKKNIFIKFAYYAYVIPVRLLQKKKKRLFDKFTDEHLKLTRRYDSFKELKNNPPQADVIFCGSDQIWNTTINNGLDPSYYAAFAEKSTIRASYAASFSISELPTEHVSFVAEMLGGMDRISVREETGLRIIENLGIKNSKVVADPVFLPSKEHWESLTKPIKYQDYVLVYDQENSPEIRKVAKIVAASYKLKIIAFRDLYPMFYADKALWNTGPIEFLSLIRNASFVVTNSFHCTAFSLIFNREFVVLPRTHQKVNSRMVDLTKAFGVPDRYLNNATEINSIKEINRASVEQELSRLRDKSIAYINDTITLKQ